MLMVFVDVVLPVLLIAAIGGTVAARVDLPVRPLAAITFDVFSPALVFEALRDVDASGTTVRSIVLVMTVSFAALTAASAAWSHVAHHDRRTRAATSLCSALANMGNMGLPVAGLAFGDPGLEVAVIALVASSVLTYSGGVMLASSASGSALGAVRAPLRVPALWAAVAALLVRVGEVSVPAPMSAATASLAGAAIPCMLVVLGLQIRAHAPAIGDLSTAAMPVGLRLCASPAIAAVLSAAVGLDGVARRTLILLAGMPTAVNATILAAQYDARPILVTQVVAVSSLLSVFTLSALVTILH